MKRRTLSLLAPLALAPLTLAAPPNVRSERAVDFNREIRPILASTCFLCHGPDSGSRQAGLRLDKPGWDAKKVLARLDAPDGSPLQMPPASAHKSLSSAQKILLRRWIASGAKYEKHWSLVAPKITPGPNNGEALHGFPQTWGQGGNSSPIDRFVLAKLKEKGLDFSPEADRATYLRRVSLDLTGLPPTVAEIDAFLADKTPQAREKVVDRLLASPHFGERMAGPWLDLARYADSYGYQSDQLSPTWPYRDWVVRAFNSNKPYDRFLTEQLAGDLLPDANTDTRLATAFNRLHRMTNEGGSVPEEWRLEGVADRVRTFSTAFLGLTMECARCHDHKYDPITQRDYYALSAFFNSIDEHGLYDAGNIVPTPSLLLPTPEQRRALGEAREVVAQAEASLELAKKRREAAFQTWRAGREIPQALPDQIASASFETLDGVEKNDDVPLVPGKVGKAIQLSGENDVHFSKTGITRHTPFSVAFWLKDAKRQKEPVVVLSATAGTDTGPYGADLMLADGVLTARMMRHWPGNAIAIRANVALPKDEWTHVVLAYDGSSRARGLSLYVNGKLAETTALKDKLYKGIGTHALTFGQRFRERGFAGGLLDELAIFSRALTPLEAARLAGAPLPDSDDALRAFYFSALDSETRAASQALAVARERVWRAEDPMAEIMDMEELPAPRPTWVLARGAYDAPRPDSARVERATPACLPPLISPLSPAKQVPAKQVPAKQVPAKQVPAREGSGVRADRLALARWLTRPDHPLTARVAVNRFWQLLFGRGLVETSEDFGTQGSAPSHPELLDWLARDFQSPLDGGRPWDVKRALKQLVLSRAYRQSSARKPELEKLDPQNVLLGRGPSGRVPAEAIRDVALAASGLLTPALGGPPVSPYQPGDLWREANTMSPGYNQSHGPDLYRRSLYTVWKRTAPMPNMTAFDSAGREVCVARRQSTSTPLQALVLLNDPTFVEAARVLGEKTLKDAGPTDAERVRFTFRSLATREPSPEEARVLGDFYAGQRKAFQAAPAEAAKLLAVGERKPDASLPPAEVAAAAMLAQAILNLDATLWKR